MPGPSPVRSDSQARNALLVILVSIVALIPCFWLPRIEAADLGSHTYNAWLASLVEQGKAPGLWIAPQLNNVLFDLLLLRLGTLIGFLFAEKIAASLAVMAFLWGAFALTSSVGGRPTWFLLPLLGMLAYGWTHSRPSALISYHRPPDLLSIRISLKGTFPIWCDADHHEPMRSVNTRNALSIGTST